jgi:subtilase family serine protease
MNRLREVRPWTGAFLIIAFLFLILSRSSFAQETFSAKSLGDYGNVTVMEVQGGYDAPHLAFTPEQALPRQAIANEFFKTHKDEYDFLVIFSNFDFQMPEKEARAFYMGVKNDTQGLGQDVFDYTESFGSNGKLQGTVDMGNLSRIATSPLDPKFEETLSILSHEMMHRWAAFVKFKETNGALSSALLGHDSAHWSFLLDSGGSVMYGNKWQDNGNGTFTSTTPQSEMKLYSPLELYLMGMIGPDKVPPMLLINSPGVDTTQLPEAGVTVTGTAQYVTIDQVIAAVGPRLPDFSIAQKNFKSAFIFITRPGTFTGQELYGIESIRNGAVTRMSILTDGAAILQVASTPTGTLPVNPGVLPPNVAPRTLPPNVNDGVAWLSANQKNDGSWADLSLTGELDTAVAVQALKDFPIAQTAYQNGLQWLEGVTSGNLDSLSRKIAALAFAGQDVSALVTDMLSRQNDDGGWGSDRFYKSNPSDTSLALKALLAAGSSTPQATMKAIGYLKTSQNPDGGWGSDDKGGMVRETSNALSALAAYRSSYSLDDVLAKGTAWLVARQNSDGGFGNSPSTVYDTAMAALTLNELNASADITSRAVAYLLGQQSGDGSWAESSYQTALAVQTVYKATIDPDLSIRQEDISITPASITGLPANVAIIANIWNLGSTPVPQAKVALYDGIPGQGNKVGEQLVAFPGQTSTAVTFSVMIHDGSQHVYTLVLDPDNQVKEPNKGNNSATKAVAPEATYDFEVLPQNITLSTAQAEMLQDVVITAKITNKGTMNAYNVHVKYYLDDPISPLDIANQTVDIPAGATITNQATWRANRASTGDNALTLAVLVDPFNNFTELSKANNKASASITVKESTTANLNVSYKDLAATPSPANQGGTTTITAVVKNDGFASASNVKVNFYEGVPGAGGILIGSQLVPVINPGDSIPVSLVWANIKDSGEKIIYVQADPDNQVQEIRKDDNDAFTTLTLLSLPDFAISPNSIVFSPGAPKDGVPVTISVTVQNRGDQAASNVVVRLSEGGVVLGDRIIASLTGNSTGMVSLSYDTTGKKGPHTVTATVDPDNLIAEQSKDNNSAANTLGVQDANFWVTEQYLSPNGDGIKDRTGLFFRLDAPQTVSLNIASDRGDVVGTD